MKTKSIFITLLLSVLFLVSCQSKEEQIISRLDNLCERIEKDGSEFEAEDWEEALKEYAQIHEEMQDCEFTEEELIELGKKEAELTSAFAKQGTKAIGTELSKILHF